MNAGNQGGTRTGDPDITRRLYQGPDMNQTNRRTVMVTAMAALLIGACSDVPSAPSSSPGVASWLRSSANDPSGSRNEPVLVGAGDIAQCYQPEDPTSITPPELTAAESTAVLLDHIPGTVMAIGDNAYEFGSFSDYLLCYQPTWGRHQQRTRPAAGNHEYMTPGAAGYFAYFGSTAAPPVGYYSYDLGSWHVIVLNSTPQWASCPPPKSTVEEGRACAGDVVQHEWLAADLAAHPRRCTLAYFHHPRFSSGLHGSQYEMQQFWDILYAADADVIISGHDHLYERFSPQDPEGNADASRGVRQFTVGTGGAALYPFTTVIPNSEVRINTTHGVLALRLRATRYEWAFISTAGQAILDSGTGKCH
jgi:hypothetical protein